MRLDTPRWSVVDVQASDLEHLKLELLTYNHEGVLAVQVGGSASMKFSSKRQLEAQPTGALMAVFSAAADLCELVGPLSVKWWFTKTEPGGFVEPHVHGGLFAGAYYLWDVAAYPSMQAIPMSFFVNGSWEALDVPSEVVVVWSSSMMHGVAPVDLTLERQGPRHCVAFNMTPVRDIADKEAVIVLRKRL